MTRGPVRLVATDLDGTLLRADRTVSPRTRAAVAALAARGVPVVPVTARQPFGLRAITEQAGLTGWALCSNGALGLHLTTGEVVFEHTITAAAQQALTAALVPALPGVRFASVRDRGDVFVAQDGYPPLADFEDHKRDPATMRTAPLAEVVAAPSLKLVARHPDLAVPALVEAIRGLGLDGFGVTHSGAPFAEVLPAGHDKSVGLAQLCAHLGVPRESVLAFGDAPNDVEMLSWAGHGVAVANAAPQTLAVADEVTSDHEHDGVALVLERVLDEL